MKVQFLEVTDYRCFDTLHVDLDPRLTIFVGINGSGKTAVLDALALFLRLYAENFYHYAESFDLPSSNLKLGKVESVLSCKIYENRFLTPNNRKNYFNAVLKFSKNILNENHLKCDNKNNFSQLADFYKKNNDSDSFPVVAYYASKRILNTYDRNKTSNSTKMHAYGSAFSPQIDFASSLAWFIAKASEEALEGQRRKDLEYAIPELSAVRKAVSRALGEYGEPFVTETPPVLFIPDNCTPPNAYRIEELSDGYRTMLALAMDLARRMAVANQHVKWAEGTNVLHSPGVVLIDEVELHLHPSWQQTVLPTLMSLFPNVQFIVTTHSPQILTSIAAKHIRILKNNSVLTMPEETEGADAARVLEDVLGVNSRPQSNEYTQKLNQYTNMVYKEEWDKSAAQKLRSELEDHYKGSEPKLKELELHIENSKWEREL